jgi:hypothetical protein
MMRGVESVCMGLDEAHRTNMSPNSSGGMLERDWSRRLGKRSHYNVNSLSLRTCNTVFVEYLVVLDVCGNVVIRVGR